MKKKKIKKKNLILYIIFIMAFFSISLITISYFVVMNNIPNKIEISLNKPFKAEKTIKVAFFNFKLHTKEKLDTSKVNNKEILYTYNFLFLKVNKKINVYVVDKEPPTFTKFTDSVEIYLDDEFKAPDFEVSDNYDDSKSIEVTIKGEVDTKTKGNYYLVYRATDKSGNSTEQVQKVTVSRASPLKMTNAEFDLTEYFPNTILKETKDMGKEYLEQIVLAGDSVFWYFPQYGLFNNNRVWAKPCIGPSNVYSEKIENKGNKTIPELISINKPKYLILNMGGCECQRNDVTKFIENYRKFLLDMKEKNPDVKIIVQTFNPVNVKAKTPYINNDWRNKFNYYLVELCESLEIPVLDVVGLFKDSKTGECKAGMCMSDGYHPNEYGMKKILEFIRTHGYKES